MSTSENTQPTNPPQNNNPPGSTTKEQTKKKETVLEKRKRLNDKKKKIADNLQKNLIYPGLVKAVISGDTAIIIPTMELVNGSGPVTELNFSLTGVKAPNLERRIKREGQDQPEKIEPEEPFAWESREYLRKRLIGKYVLYRVEFREKNKCYGEIYLVEGQNTINVREDCIKNGWVRVSERKALEDKDYTTPDIQKYNYIKSLQATALGQGIGVHSRNNSKIEASIRHVHRHNFKSGANKMAFELFEKIKNFPLHGVVEQVRDGSTIRVILIERMDEITINLSGVKCPNNKMGPTPYTFEAKFITEFFLLNRDVEVYIETLDELNNFYGSVKLVDKPDFDITFELLSRGLGQFIEWSVSKGVDINELRKAEELAKSKKLKYWKRFIPRKEGNVEETNSRDLTGKVVEIVSPSSIKIIPKGSKSKEPFIVRLSSVKVPRLIKDGEEPNIRQDDPKRNEKLERFREDKANSVYYAEAKEFLRKKLISQVVSCLFDYDYSGEGGYAEYYSVYFKDNNVACDLLENGYGKVAIHADNQRRSRDYQKLVYAQNKAARVNKGIHTPSDRKPVYHVNDLTFNFDSSKSNLYLNFLKRPGRVSGVVEYIFGASRYKIWIPSENCIITLAVQGLYCEAPEKNKETKSSSPYDLYPLNTPGNRGLHFARDFLFQRDVEVIVNDVEKSGCFHGRVYFGGEDIAPVLLREGFARIHNPSAKTMEEFEIYKQAEEIAKLPSLNMWENYDPEEEEGRRQRNKDQREALKQQEPEKVALTITEIIDGSTFYYQIIGPETDQLNILMQEINSSNIDNEPAYDPKYKEFIFAKFSIDDKYYRGKVLGVKELKDEKKVEYRVLFIDYGNTETLTRESIRAMNNSKYGQLPPQANSGKLLYVKSPKFTADYGQEAAELFRDLVWEKQLIGIVQARDRSGNAYLNLGDPINKTHINAHMVKEGFARIENRRSEDPIYLKLKEEEDVARLNKIGMWEHGTVPDSDEEREEEKMKKGIL